MAERLSAWFELTLNALDIQTLIDYHESSFEDPPSYHEEVTDLWECPMCIEAYIRRSSEVLKHVRADVIANSVLG